MFFHETVTVKEGKQIIYPNILYSVQFEHFRRIQFEYIFLNLTLLFI